MHIKVYFHNFLRKYTYKLTLPLIQIYTSLIIYGKMRVAHLQSGMVWTLGLFRSTSPYSRGIYDFLWMCVSITKGALRNTLICKNYYVNRFMIISHISLDYQEKNLEITLTLKQAFKNFYFRIKKVLSWGELIGVKICT